MRGMTNRGVGVQVAAHVLDLKLQLVLCPLRGTLFRESEPSVGCSENMIRAVAGAGEADPYLEGEMLEEVGGAVGLGGLGAGAGIDPHADGRGLGIG